MQLFLEVSVGGAQLLGLCLDLFESESELVHDALEFVHHATLGLVLVDQVEQLLGGGSVLVLHLVQSRLVGQALLLLLHRRLLGLVLLFVLLQLFSRLLTLLLILHCFQSCSLLFFLLSQATGFLF